jgi:hypothetical protein
MVDYADPLVVVTIALVGVTAGLVAVTAFYAVQTQRTVKEMKRGNEMQFLPSLVVTFNTFVDVSGGIRKVRFFVQNVGRGAALDIRIKLSVKEKSVIPDNFQFPLLSVQEHKRLDFDAGFKSTSNIDKTIVNVELNYKNIFGSDIDESRSVEVKG